MKTIYAPKISADWRKVASAIIKANLKLCGMNYVDLSRALAEIGVDEPPKYISAKLVRGTFSASFLLQSLSVMGVERIDVPGRRRE